jgi:hypothetical protein
MYVAGSHLSASFIVRLDPPVRALTPPGTTRRTAPHLATTFLCAHADKAALSERRLVGTPCLSASAPLSPGCQSPPGVVHHLATGHGSRRQAGALPRLAIATPPTLGHSTASHSVAPSPVSCMTGHLTPLVISSGSSSEFGATVSPVHAAHCRLPPATDAADEQPSEFIATESLEHPSPRPSPVLVPTPP